MDALSSRNGSTPLPLARREVSFRDIGVDLDFAPGYEEGVSD